MVLFQGLMRSVEFDIERSHWDKLVSLECNYRGWQIAGFEVSAHSHKETQVVVFAPAHVVDTFAVSEPQT